MKHIGGSGFWGFCTNENCPTEKMRTEKTGTEATIASSLGIRCGRVMADNIAYAKFRKKLLI